MHIRTVINFVNSHYWDVLGELVARRRRRRSLPELRAGDVLLCEPYPYRTVTNTSRTVYQIARLGFPAVRSFQQTHSLTADGIIGP
jgi:hypothetical protein